MIENDGCFRDRREFLKVGGYFTFALASLPIFAIIGEGADAEKRYPIPAADSANIDYKAQVILVRYQNAIFAFALSCPHENAAVKWVSKSNRFQCSKHDSRYQPDGVHTAGRATRNMDRFAVRRDGDSVVVNVQHWFQSDRDPAGWASAAIHL